MFASNAAVRATGALTQVGKVLKAAALIAVLSVTSISPISLIPLQVHAHGTQHAAQVGSDRQMRIFQKLWKIVNDTYVYPNFNGIDWKGKKTEIEAKINAGLGDSEFYFLLRKLIESLNDQHSVYLPPFVAEELFDLYFNPAAYEGVGLLTASNRERGYLYVLQVVPGSSADKAGIRPHDHITHIGGYPALDRDGYSQSFLLAGPAGSEVPVNVQSPGGGARSISLMRESIPNLELVDQRMLPSTNGKKIGYINIPTFFSQTIDKQIKAGLRELMTQAGGKLDGLVIDVRTNSGGSIQTLGNTLNAFAKGPLGRFRSRKGIASNISGRGEAIGNSQTVPLVVLISPDTASAAEVFAGSLQAKGRARLVGQTSAGNIEGLRTYFFEDGSLLFIAEQAFVLPNGTSWEGKGLQPVLSAPGNWDDITIDNDPAVNAGLNLLAQ